LTSPRDRRHPALSPKNARRPTCRSALVPRRDRGEDARAPPRGVTIVPDTPRAAKSREEDRAPYLLLVRARLAVLRQELQDLVDARLLRLPHGRRGRSGHGLAAAASVSRLVRPVLTRRRRSDDRVATRERRNRQAARATRCDARSPQSIADPRVENSSIGARHASVASWRRTDGSGAQTATNVRRETPFLGTPRKKVPQCTSARSSAHVRPRTRLDSRRETRARCGVRGAHRLHIRVRAVGPRGASPARPPRASAGFPRSRSALSFFAGGGNESSSRTRGSRPCAHAVSLRESRAPPVTYPRSSLRHAHARSQHARSRETASRHYGRDDG
jgi:hypothetical protein